MRSIATPTAPAVAPTITDRVAPPSLATALVLATFVVLMGATWFQHTDVGDAQVYQVIARNMLRDTAG